RLSESQVWNRSRWGESEFHVSAAGQLQWLRQPRNAISIASRTSTTAPARPRHHGAGSVLVIGWAASATAIPSLALAGDRGEDGGLVDDAHDASVLDGADRLLARCDQRHGLADGRRDVQRRPLAVLGARVAHDPAQREHVAARDVAHEVLDVFVRRRPDE